MTGKGGTPRAGARPVACGDGEWRFASLGRISEKFAAYGEEVDGAMVPDAVVDPAGDAAGKDDAAGVEHGQMLGGVAVAGADGGDEVLHAHFTVAEQAYHFVAQGMGHGLDGIGQLDDVGFAKGKSWHELLLIEIHWSNQSN